MNKKENNIHNLKIIVSTMLALVTVTTGITATIKLNKKSEFDEHNVTFNSYIESVEKTTQYTTNENYVFFEAEQDNTNFNYTYEQLNKMLDEALLTKQYSEEVCKLIHMAFDSVNSGYDVTYDLYKDYGLKTKEEYLLEFIDSIKQISSIELVDENNSEFSQYKEILSTSRGIYVASSNTMILNNKYNFSDLVSTLEHERRHFIQDSGIISNKLAIPSGIYKVLSEGDAADSSKLLDATVRYNSRKNVETEDCLYKIYGTASNDNLYYARYYNMLGVLAGFDVLDSFCNNGYDQELLINKINSNFDIDAEKFIKNIELVCQTVEDSPKKVINEMCDIEREYISCLKEKVAKSNSREEVCSVFNVYRDYKIQYSFSCVEYEKDITGELLATDELESLLLEKIVEYGLLPAGLEKDMFDLLLLNVGNMQRAGLERNIKNIKYCQLDENVVLINKTNNKYIVYNTKDKINDYSCEISQDIIDSCEFVVEDNTEKTLV